MWRLLSILSVSLLIMACQDETVVDQEMPARPVTVVNLVERDFSKQRQLTGVVGLYRGRGN